MSRLIVSVSQDLVLVSLSSINEHLVLGFCRSLFSPIIDWSRMRRRLAQRFLWQCALSILVAQENVVLKRLLLALAQ